MELVLIVRFFLHCSCEMSLTVDNRLFYLLFRIESHSW